MNAVTKPARAPKPTDVATFEAPRLPWHDAIGDRFSDLGVTKATWKVLCEAIWPAAKTANSVVMALSYCQSRRLDPFKKVVHIVPVWDTAKSGYVETVWPSISEMRTTAFRTGQYAGCDETKFGPDIERTFKDKIKQDGKWVEATKTVTFPEWAQITVYRMVGGQRVPFVGPRVYWLETYARMERSEIPNEMWSKRTRGQIEKCSEAAALRKAFPEELGNEYSAEEMEGQRFFHEMRDVTPKPQIAAPEDFSIPEEPAPIKAVPQQTAPAAKPPEPELEVVATPAAETAADDDGGMPPDDDDGWPGPVTATKQQRR